MCWMEWTQDCITTLREMCDLPGGGKIIDAAGDPEWDYGGYQQTGNCLQPLHARNVGFFLAGCQFNNCIHRDELGCVVKSSR